MSVKPIRNLPIIIAEPYVANFLTDAYDVSTYYNGCTPNYTRTASVVSCSYNDGRWYLGFPKAQMSFKLPNYHCSKVKVTISQCSGVGEVVINGVSYKSVDIHEIAIDKNAKYISVVVDATTYASRGGTGYSETTTVTRIEFLK